MSLVGVVTAVTSASMGAVVSVVVVLSLVVELSLVVVAVSVNSSFSSLQEMMVRLEQVNAKKAAM